MEPQMTDEDLAANLWQLACLALERNIVQEELTHVAVVRTSLEAESSDRHFGDSLAVPGAAEFEPVLEGSARFSAQQLSNRTLH